MHEETLLKLLDDDTTKTLKNLISSGETPLWHYWEEFVTDYIKEGRSKVTIGNVRDKLRFVTRILQIITIENCNQPVELRRKLFKIADERNWQPTTINSYVKDLNTYFIWLEDMEYIQENKLRKFRKCKETENEQYSLQEDQIKQLQAHMLNRRQNHQVEVWRNKLFIELSILTGARPCELADIRFRDIVKTNNHYVLEIRGHKQKGKLRRYKLPTQIVSTFEMYLFQRQRIGREETSLFISLSSKEGWTYKGMTSLMKKLSKELGFRVHSYAIRRFVATKLWNKDTPLRDIMNHLGHNRISTTLKYVDKGSQLTQKGVDVMGEMF
jgi:integrase/recombinase XerD